METHDAVTKNNKWEISTACDIRLSSFFTNNQTLPPNAYIDIDPSAISDALHDLDEGASGNILLMAAHGDSLNKSSKPNQLPYTLGNHSYSNGSHIVNVVIARGGQSINLNGNTVDTREVRRSSEVQRTSIHELSHVTDVDNQQMSYEMVKHRHKYELAVLPFQISASIVGALAVSETVKESNSLLDFCFILIGSSVTAYAARHSTKKYLERKEYLSSPNEIKARSLGESAMDYPSVFLYRY